MFSSLFFLTFLFVQNSFGLQSDYVSIRIDCLPVALEQKDLQKCPEMAITMPKDTTNSLFKKSSFCAYLAKLFAGSKSKMS